MRRPRSRRSGPSARQGSPQAASPQAASPQAAPTRAASPAAAPPASQEPVRETSAGGIVYRLVDGGPQYLLIRDSYRNWGFPKGHLEGAEGAESAALREVQEETGVADVVVTAPLDTIEWSFRFRGTRIHKVCHFYLMRADGGAETRPQRAEGITACRWAPYDDAMRLLSYANARDLLRRAHAALSAA